MMTRKNFEAIAKILKTQKANHKTILSFSEMLVMENPRFDHSRFIEAAGYWE